ncbi:MAG: DNA repair protein RadC [Marinifilaceae bacterium]|nr:DNA repair protein RadC [Marinifilaceae bacterium]
MSGRLTVKEWADDERPREKMMAVGAVAMSCAELLAIIMRSGDGNENVVDLARRVLADYGNDLNRLAHASPNELMSRYSGIGVAKATAIVSAMELSRRRIGSINSVVDEPLVIRSSRDAYGLLFSFLGDLDHEEFWALFLARSNRVIASERVASGGIDATYVDLRLLLKMALEHKAVSIIVAHNHPSGNLIPSISDRELTNKIKKSSDLMDIRLFDHIIIASGGGYYSFLDEGLL